MSKPTVRDIHEIVAGLDRISADFREIANTPPLVGSSPPAVPLTLVSLIDHASYLGGLATTLRELIPEDEVELAEASVTTDTSPGT